MTPTLSVIVAAYHEEAVLAENIQRIVATLEERPHCPWELLLVNDGSTDRTGEIMDSAATADGRVRVVHMRGNGGQGRALRAGFAMARGETVVTLDADLSYHPRYIWLLSDALEQQQVDIALASAYEKGGAVRNVPLLRALLSRWGNRYLSMLHPYDLATYTCVVRAYRREVLDTLYLTANGMEMQVEILTKAAMVPFRVGEIPAELVWSLHKTREASGKRVSKMRIGHSINLYLQWGWFSCPAWPVALLGGVIFLPGFLLGGWLFWNMAQSVDLLLQRGATFSLALSYTLSTLSTRAMVASAALMITGLLIGLLSLLFLQNRHHFQELYRVQQEILQRMRPPGRPQA